MIILKKGVFVMSFLIKYKNGNLVKKSVFFKRETPCPVTISDDNNTFVIGDIFAPNMDDIFSLKWTEVPNSLNTIEGDISIIKSENEKCYFASDICGIGNVIYYHKSGVFIISDDIWDIVREIEPDFADLDTEWIKRSIFTAVIDGSTFLNNTKVLLRSQIGIYNAIDDTLNVKEYREFRYSGQIVSLEEAVKSVDESLNKMFNNLSEKFPKKRFGMGLSGGLDSRVIPHYAKKYNLDLLTFNVCNYRPNGIFKANSCINAKKLAEAYGLPIEFVEWTASDLERKIELKTINMPFGFVSRNSFKFEDKKLPSFDIMLSGGFGILIGDYLPLNIDELDAKGVADAIRFEFVKSSPTTTFMARVKKGLNYIFNMNLDWKEETNKNINIEEFFKDTLDGISDSVDEYVNQRFGRYTNTEIFESYFFNVVSLRDRWGAFESQLGTKRSFAIYLPFIFKQIIKWNEKLLLGRQVLPALIVKHIPEAAFIGTDSFSAAPGSGNGVISKIYAVLSRFIRGNGTAIDENNFNKKEVQNTIYTRMNNDCKWFYKIMDIRKIQKDIFVKKQLRVALPIYEMKFLIDYIENKKYK